MTRARKCKEPTAPTSGPVSAPIPDKTYVAAGSLHDTFRELARLCAAQDKALRQVYSHLVELADAWERGAITEHDELGGTRSNRNADVLRVVRAALSPSHEPNGGSK